MAIHVLIVEDDTRLSRMYEKVLVYEGYKVLSVDTNEGAIQGVVRFDPDVICLDWNLGDQTCEPFLTSLQSFPAAQRPAVVVVSAEVTPEKVAPYEDIIEKVVIKPITLKALTRLVKDLGQAKANREHMYDARVREMIPGVVYYTWKGVVTAQTIRQIMHPELQKAHTMIFDIKEATLERLSVASFEAPVHPTVTNLKNIHVIHAPDFYAHASFLMNFMKDLPIEIHYHQYINDAVRAALEHHAK